MPNLILSPAMDSFLAESDPANVLLPLTGGTMSTGADIAFANGSMLREGTTDAGNGGAGGIAQVCSISYELKWEAGRLYVMEQDGFTIRVEQYGFTSAPTSGDDDTKGYIVGSRRILDDGTTYVCTDATTGAAVWALDKVSLAFLNYQLVDSTGAVVMDWDETANQPSFPYGLAVGASSIEMGGGAAMKDGALTYSNNNVLSWQSGSLIFADGVRDFGGVSSIDTNNRQLLGVDGTTVTAQWGSSYFEANQIYGIGRSKGVDFYGGYLMDGPNIVVNWPYNSMYDLGGSQSIDWGMRYLADASGTYSVDWSNRYLRDGTGGLTTVDWGGRQLIDSYGSVAYNWGTGQIGHYGALKIDVANSQLIGTNGYTVMLDWSGSIYPTAPTLASLVLTEGWIMGSDGLLTIGSSTRQLFGSDGMTIAADWSTGTPAFAQGASYTPTAYASLPATPVEGTVCYVNDASTPVSLGAVVTDGGSEKVLACFNGTDWKVIAHL